MSIKALVFPHRYVLGYPEVDDARALCVDVPSILSTRYKGDAHFAAYAADHPRRIKVSLLKEDRHAEKIPGVNLRMTLFVGDVDWPGHADELPATQAWREEQAPKMAAMLASHPRGFVYDTRGGFRIVYALPEPFPLLSSGDDARWTCAYKSWGKYLERSFGIAIDLNCADWTRLYRAPHVTRDGVRQERAAIGDPTTLGVWAPQLTKRDAVRARPIVNARYGVVEPVSISDVDSDYGQRRTASAIRYLETAPLSIKGAGGRTTMFAVCLYLVRRLRLPLEIAADLLVAHYNPRLSAAGTSQWARDQAGPHGGCIMERLAKARDTGTVEIGDVMDEALWNELNRARVAS
jgi:hypothetical protein